MREGVVGASLDVDGSHYFDIHHTHADTLDKVNPQDLALCVAAMAVMAYTVADMPQPLSEAGAFKQVSRGLIFDGIAEFRTVGASLSWAPRVSHRGASTE